MVLKGSLKYLEYPKYRDIGMDTLEKVYGRKKLRHWHRKDEIEKKNQETKIQAKVRMLCYENKMVKMRFY